MCHECKCARGLPYFDTAAILYTNEKYVTLRGQQDVGVLKKY